MGFQRQTFMHVHFLDIYIYIYTNTDTEFSTYIHVYIYRYTVRKACIDKLYDSLHSYYVNISMVLGWNSSQDAMP